MMGFNMHVFNSHYLPVTEASWSCRLSAPKKSISINQISVDKRGITALSHKAVLQMGRAIMVTLRFTECDARLHETWAYWHKVLVGTRHLFDFQPSYCADTQNNEHKKPKQCQHAPVFPTGPYKMPSKTPWKIGEKFDSDTALISCKLGLIRQIR